MTSSRVDADLLDDGAVPRPRPRSCDRIERASWICFWANIVMAALKIAFGALGYSSLFVIDGLFSAALAAHAGALLTGAQMSDSRFFSRRYSYGRGKVQFLLAMLLGGLLVVGASVALGLTIKRFGHAVLAQASAGAVMFAVVAIAGNSLLWSYLRTRAAASADPGLRTAASYQALSIASSLSVLQSVVLIAYHSATGERVGRLSISLLMLWLAVQIIRSSLDGVMDQSSGREIEDDIRRLAGSVRRVQEVSSVRSRRAGQTVHVDVEVALDARCTVSDGEQVAAQIKRLIANRLEQPPSMVNVAFSPPGEVESANARSRRR